MAPPEHEDAGNPFQSLLGDLMNMLGSTAPDQWEMTRSFALNVATGGTAEPNVAPIQRIRVEQLSRAVGDVVPELVSWKWELRDRSGHARLDYTQNAGHKTLVAPYSPRPSAGAPVSAPIDWDELGDPALRPDGFTIRNIMDRLAERGDLFRPVLDTNQVLPPIT